MLATKPVFLFHAADDTMVAPEETENLHTLMTDRGKSSRRVVVEVGGHYDSMIRDGIPKAIDWFGRLP